MTMGNAQIKSEESLSLGGTTKTVLAGGLFSFPLVHLIDLPTAVMEPDGTIPDMMSEYPFYPLLDDAAIKCTTHCNIATACLVSKSWHKYITLWRNSFRRMCKDPDML